MKAQFTQSAMILLKRAVPLDAVEDRLRGFRFLARRELSLSWVFGSPVLLLAMEPPAVGKVVVDVVPHIWPDAMEDTPEQSEIFGGWGLGQFGPFVWPGSLLRAGQHAWGSVLASLAEQHQAFVRIRTTYPGEADDPILPEDYDPFPELLLVTEIAAALFDLPGCLCYFNPNGEALRDEALIRQQLGRYKQGGPLPLYVWVNPRLFHFSDGAKWSMTDLVGLQQLDVPFGTHQWDMPDHEACFPTEEFDPGAIPSFLYNTAHYMINNRAAITSGDTIDNPLVPGEVWKALVLDRSKMLPPRPVIRWFPYGSQPPAPLLE